MPGSWEGKYVFLPLLSESVCCKLSTCLLVSVFVNITLFTPSPEEDIRAQQHLVPRIGTANGFCLIGTSNLVRVLFFHYGYNFCVLPTTVSNHFPLLTHAILQYPQDGVFSVKRPLSPFCA